MAKSTKTVGIYQSILCFIVCISALAANSHSLPVRGTSEWENNEDIKLFREYLRIPTVHPDIDYQPAVNLLKKIAEELHLPATAHFPVNFSNPVLVLTWEGSQPELPSIMLNSHMDVGPVYEEFWTHPPFGAEMDENGDIFARGAQDAKASGIQYLAAIRELKRRGVERLKRNVYISYVPDEEVGGARGMKAFTEVDYGFKHYNIAFVLDEGNAPTDDDGILPAFYVERTLWRMEFTFHGKTGHASMLFDDTPGVKLNYLLNKLTEYREEEKRKLDELNYPYGNVTSINLTVLKGGIATNIIPAEMSATFDMRISTNTDFETFEKQVYRWCEEAGGNITIKTLDRSEKEIPTVVDDSNPYWVAFKKGVEDNGLKVKPMVVTANTDSRFVRALNVSAIGFSPLMDTEFRAHDHNEYINAETFLKGIDVYANIIYNLGNV